MKAITLKTNSCLGKKKSLYICPDVVHDFTGFMTESIKENRKEIVNMEKKVGGEHFQDTDFERIQELINATPEKLIEDDLMDINASKLVPDTKEEDAEASPGNKSAIDNLVEGF